MTSFSCFVGKQSLPFLSKLNPVGQMQYAPGSVSFFSVQLVCYEICLPNDIKRLNQANTNVRTVKVVVVTFVYVGTANK